MVVAIGATLRDALALTTTESGQKTTEPTAVINNKTLNPPITDVMTMEPGPVPSVVTP